MKKIYSLTPEQEKQMIDYRQEWLDLGRSTKPINQVEAEQAINDLYEFVLDKPKPAIIYCQSPWQMCVTPEVLKKLGKFEGDNLWGNLVDNLVDNLAGNLVDNLVDNLAGNLRDNLAGNLRGNLRDNLWGNLAGNLRGNLRDNLAGNLRDNLAKDAYDNFHWICQGSWGLYWLSTYDFADKFIKSGMYSKDDKKKLEVALSIARSVAAITPYEGICFVSDRPLVLTVDDQGRLHNETGPALRYADGYEIFMWHGIEIKNKNIIENPSSITLTQIEGEPNAEVRRIMMERFGWGRYLKESNAQLMDQYLDSLGNPVKLWRKELGSDFNEPVLMVEMVNSTIEGLYDSNGRFTPDLKDGKTYHKSYMFCVPPTIKTAKQAHAWHLGIDADEVEFIQQT